MGYVALKGIVISAQSYREKDRILTIFSDQMGKIRAKIRSVRSANSKRSGLSDEFLYEKFLLYRKGNFFTITETELISAFLDAKAQIDNYLAFLYIKELVLLFIPYEQEDMRIFNLILNTLEFLKNRDVSKVATVYFVLHFLRFWGNPVKTLQITADDVFFSAKEGGFNTEEGTKVNKAIMEQVSDFYEKNIEDINKTGNEIAILRLLNEFIYYHTESKHFLKFLETIRKIDNI